MTFRVVTSQVKRDRGFSTLLLGVYGHRGVLVVIVLDGGAEALEDDASDGLVRRGKVDMLEEVLPRVASSYRFFCLRKVERNFGTDRRVMDETSLAMRAIFSQVCVTISF